MFTRSFGATEASLPMLALSYVLAVLFFGTDSVPKLMAAVKPPKNRFHGLSWRLTHAKGGQPKSTPRLRCRDRIHAAEATIYQRGLLRYAGGSRCIARLFQ